MSRTRNISCGTSHSAINAEFFRILAKEGSPKSGHTVHMSTDAVAKAREEISSLIRRLNEIHEIGGYLLVQAGDQQITAYRLNSFSRKLSRAKRG